MSTEGKDVSNRTKEAEIGTESTTRKRSRVTKEETKENHPEPVGTEVERGVKAGKGQEKNQKMEKIAVWILTRKQKKGA